MPATTRRRRVTLVPSPDAYDSTPPRGSRPEYTRIYLPGGREAHLSEAVS